MSQNVTGEKELSPRQVNAIAALLSEPTLEKAAEKVGVSKRQLQRWLDDPYFKAELKATQAQAIDAACMQLAGAASEAIGVLKEIMNDPMPAKGAGSRVRAAAILLESLIRLKQFAEFDTRLAILEERLKVNV